MKMRFYQKDIVKAQNEFMLNDSEQRGQVYSPTGSGKTVCFDSLITKMIKGKTNKKICIVYPRIALAIDQQDRLKGKTNVEFTSFHSGSNNAPEEAKLYRKQISTTSREQLKEIHDTTKMNHITFVTYHSFKHIANMDFDLIICDEAHNLVQSNFAESLPIIKSKVIFYTATPIFAINGLETVIGMNNEQLFGKVICNVKPKELIEKGYIVPPRLVELSITTDEDGIAVEPHLTISHAFKDQKERLNKVTNKMLVAMSDTRYFDEIQSRIDDMRRIVGDIDLYTITAGTQRKNSVNLDSREAALKDFANNKNQCIILHCDTLAEGIDVPGITGVFVYRTLSKAKLIQTIGRAARPSLADMDKNGEVIDMENRLKPYAIVTIPVIDNKYYANINSNTICQAFIEGGYGDNLKDISQFISKERAGGNKAADSAAVFVEPEEQSSITYSEIKKVIAEEIDLEVIIDPTLDLGEQMFGF